MTLLIRQDHSSIISQGTSSLFSLSLELIRFQACRHSDALTDSAFSRYRSVPMMIFPLELTCSISVLENQLQSWSTDFGFLPPSSPLSETAEASGVIVQLKHTCVPTQRWSSKSRSKPRKTGKIPHMSWKTKMWWPKNPKSVFTGFANELPKASRWRF